MARWRSGNAGVCKTSMRGSDSLTRLKVCLAELDPALQDKTAIAPVRFRSRSQNEKLFKTSQKTCIVVYNDYHMSDFRKVYPEVEISATSRKFIRTDPLGYLATRHR